MSYSLKNVRNRKKKGGVDLLNPEIKRYVESAIIPQYSSFDKAHQMGHARSVIAESLHIAADYPVSMDMVYVIAAYHDLGLSQGREGHEIRSGGILIADAVLSQWFSDKELVVMKNAVEDHRASIAYEPRTIYGKIVAEADRQLSCRTIVQRCILYSLSHFPDYSDEEHLGQVYAHISEKYGENGYLKLWLNTKRNTEGLEELRCLLADDEQFRAYFKECFASCEKIPCEESGE